MVLMSSGVLCRSIARLIGDQFPLDMSPDPSTVSDAIENPSSSSRFTPAPSKSSPSSDGGCRFEETNFLGGGLTAEEGGQVNAKCYCNNSSFLAQAV